MKKKVLVLDDHDDIADLIKFYLEEEDFIVETHNSSANFLAKIRSFQPDLITLDILLPDGNGLDIFRELQLNKSTSDIPIIFITVKEEDKSMVINMGAQGFIIKPFKEKEIKSIVVDLLRGDK